MCVCLVWSLQVEEDGTIVPASENEVMEMESLMEGKSPVHVTDPLEIQLDLKHSCIINKPDNLTLKEKSSVGIVANSFLIAFVII